ncbi:OLC1v1021627C2 [Oldenlandia corymbosa var. corymbosa]|nr:OLC1v1021627C2 [Oldenlandia corymbosa var. corymbosa]
MGCCVSSNAKSAPGNEDQKIQNPKENRAPLPEEESVKEVLSETPSLPKKPAVLSRTRQERLLLENDDPKKIRPLLPTISKAQEEKLKNDGVFKKSAGASFNSEEFFTGDAASELCSTHSGRSVLSTATYNSTDNYKHDDEGQRSFRQKSLSGTDSRRERVVGRSPARRPEQSPGRARNGPGVGTRAGSGTAGNGQRRDSAAEGCGRGSRSPAKRADNGGGSKTVMVRSGSGKKSGKSPGRAKSDRSDKILKLDDLSGSNRQNGNWPPTTTGNESLENPLVSLECFIFL